MGIGAGIYTTDCTPGNNHLLLLVITFCAILKGSHEAGSGETICSRKSRRFTVFLHP